MNLSLKKNKRTQVFAALLLVATSFFALSRPKANEPQDPKTLCERFVTPLEITTCEDQMRLLKPDWYLASLCAKQFDDKAFYSCLNITRLGSFSPDKLDRCAVVEKNDEDRMTCARGALTSKPAEIYQSNVVPRPTARKGSFRVSDGH